MEPVDLGYGYRLRPALDADRDALAEVCLRTGDAGNDATGKEDDRSLLGQLFAVPYQALEPDFAFVIAGADGVAGYLLGTPDTASFYRRLLRDWYPALRARLSDPGADAARWRGSDWLRRLVFSPELPFPPALAAYPAHGHIDLLPEARGRGIGERSMRLLMARLAAAGAGGVHLHVHPANLPAQGFYRHLGFVRLADPALPRTTLFMARRLP